MPLEDRDRYCTPGEILCRVRRHRGAIDLDPFHDDASIVEAAAVFDLRRGQDALARRWAADTVFANGPWSISEAWVPHAAAQWRSGAARRVFGLCQAAPGARYWESVWRWASVCFLTPRVAFLVRGQPLRGASIDHALIFWGPAREHQEFGHTWSERGQVVRAVA